MWTAVRRPLFVALVLATAVSIVTCGAVSLRVVGPAMIYWALVPAIELAALGMVVGSRWRGLPASVVIDAFFAGHGPWLLGMIALALTAPMLGPDDFWPALLGFAGIGVPVILVWSARIDVRFFREVVGATRGRAIRDAVVMRLIVWPLVLGLFAEPGMNPMSLVRDLTGPEVVTEILK